MKVEFVDKKELVLQFSILVSYIVYEYVFRDCERKKQSKRKIKNRIGGDEGNPGRIGEGLQTDEKRERWDIYAESWQI